MEFKNIKDGTNRIVYAFAVCVAVMVFNVLVIGHNRQYDITSDRVHTLAPQSVNIARALTEDIKVMGFFSEQTMPLKAGFESLLQKYMLESSRIKPEFVDPVKNPMAAQNYQITSDGTVILVKEDRKVVLEALDEEGFTQGLIRLVSDSDNVVYFLQGHGEYTIEPAESRSVSIASSRLKDMNLTVKTVNLIETGAIPEDCDALIISGANAGFLPQELPMVADYLDNGGRLFLTIDPDAPEALADFARGYGFALRNDIIIETGTLTRLMGGDIFTPLVNSFPEHPVNEGFDSACFFPTARSVLPSGGNENMGTIAETSDTSWAETDESIFQFDEGEDIEGPVSIAAACSFPAKKEDGGIQSRVIVTGDSDFMTDNYFSVSGNGNFFLNIINWLVDREELISIVPNSRKSNLMILTAAQGSALIWACAVIIPLLPLIIGFFVWLRRRHL